MRQSRTSRRWATGPKLAAATACLIATAGVASAQITTYSNAYNGGSTTFLGLGFFADAGTMSTSTRQSQALALSADARYVTGFSYYETTGGAQVQEAFRLDLQNLGQGYQKIGNLGGTPPQSIGFGVANSGTVVGQSNSSNGSEGFVRANDPTQTQPTVLPPLDPLNHFSSGQGISSDGTRAVGYSAQGASIQATYWDIGPTGTPSPAVPLNDFNPNPINGQASGISSNASVIVGSGTANDPSAGLVTAGAVWTVNNGVASSPRQLPFLSTNAGDTPEAVAFAVSPNANSSTSGSADGIAAGYSRSIASNGQGAYQAVYWTLTGASATAHEIGFLGLPPSGPFDSRANGVSQSNQWGVDGWATIIGSSTSGNVVASPLNPTSKEAFLYRTADGTIRSLQSILQAFNLRDSNNQLLPDGRGGQTGWTLVDALAISADGNTIVGWGIDPEGHAEAWVAVLAVPEPASGLSFLTLAGVAVLRRRIRRSTSVGKFK